MPATRNPHDPIPPAAPPPSTPNGGAWTYTPPPAQVYDIQGYPVGPAPPKDGTWTWTPNATPDPTLVNQWGYGAMTDISQDPTGTRNHGAWTPVHGGGWQWTWGANPDPSLVGTYGTDKLTNPDRTPGGADTSKANTPTPPDVKPPDVTDAWHGVAPDVTGVIPGAQPSDAVGGTLSMTAPPPHPAFMVSPGGIRNAEQSLLHNIDEQIANYDSLKAYVAMSHGQHLADSDIGVSNEYLVNTQDRLLLGIGDALELAGQFTQMLNVSAQSYAKADIDSFLPDS